MSPGPLRGVSAATVLAGLALLAAPHRPVHEAVGPADLATLTLEPHPPDSLVFVSSDDLASTATYAQAVEGVRPDVLVVVKQHASDPLAADALARRDTAGRVPGGPPLPGPTAALTALLSRNRRRVPVFWEVGDSATDSLVAGAALGFPLLEEPAAGPLPKRDVVALADAVAARWRALAGGALEPESAAVLGRLVSLSGVFAFGRGDAAGADALVTAAGRLAPDDTKVRLNLAARLIDARRHGDAIALLEGALEAQPDSALTAFNLGLAEASLGQLGPARAAFRHAAALGIGPRRAARALEVLAVGEANEGHYARAAALLWPALPALPPRSRSQAEATLGRLLVLLAK